MPTDRLARLRADIEQLPRYAPFVEFRLTTWKEHGIPDQLGGWFPQMDEDGKGEWVKLSELEGVLADPPQAHEKETHYEMGNCPHCGAWVNFAQEHAIEQLPAAPTPADGAPQEQEP